MTFNRKLIISALLIATSATMSCTRPEPPITQNPSSGSINTPDNPTTIETENTQPTNDTTATTGTSGTTGTVDSTATTESETPNQNMTTDAKKQMAKKKPAQRSTNQ